MKDFGPQQHKMDNEELIVELIKSMYIEGIATHKLLNDILPYTPYSRTEYFIKRIEELTVLAKTTTFFALELGNSLCNNSKLDGNQKIN